MSKSDRPHCVICGLRIHSSWKMDKWGRSCCAHHEVSSCWCCGRLHQDRYTGSQAGLCRACRDTSIQSADLSSLHTQVLRFLLERLGINLEEALPLTHIRLVSPEEFGSSVTPLLGQARASTTTQMGVRVSIEHEVLLRAAMPRLLAGGVLAHECFHVFSTERGLSLPKPLEEGTANLLEYFWYQQFDAAAARRHKQRMLENPDPIYGDGFRRVRLAYKATRSFSRMLEGLHRDGH